MSEDDKYHKASSSNLFPRALLLNRLWETNWVRNFSRRSVILVLCCLCYYAAWGSVQSKQPSTVPENIKADFQDLIDVGERRRRDSSGKVNRFDAPRLRAEEIRAQKEASSRSEQERLGTEQQQATPSDASNKKRDSEAKPSTLKDVPPFLNRDKVNQVPSDLFQNKPEEEVVHEDEMQFPMMPKQQKSPETSPPAADVESPPIQREPPIKKGSVDPVGLDMVKNVRNYFDCGSDCLRR